VGRPDRRKLVEQLIGQRVARGEQEALEPCAARETTAKRRLGQDLHGARFGRQAAGFLALDRVAGNADQLTQLVLDDRCLLALAVYDAADAGLEQAAECF
jgi:hypothetical protein